MVTVQSVIDNLTITIEGKRQLLKDLELHNSRAEDPIQRTVLKATAEFLKINLIELRNIKDHLLETQK